MNIQNRYHDLIDTEVVAVFGNGINALRGTLLREDGWSLHLRDADGRLYRIRKDAIVYLREG